MTVRITLGMSVCLRGQAEGAKEQGAGRGGESGGTGREGFPEAMALKLDLRAQGEFRCSEECSFQMRGAITAESHR